VTLLPVAPESLQFREIPGSLVFSHRVGFTPGRNPPGITTFFMTTRVFLTMTPDPFRYDLLTIVLLFLILATVFIVYFPLAATIILGLTLAIVMEPLEQRLARRMSHNRSAALTTLLVLTVAGLGLFFIVSILIQGGGWMLSMIKTINTWLATIRPGYIMSGVQLATALNSVVAFLKAQLIPLLASVPLMLFHAFILLLSVYLFLLKGSDISRQIISALPEQLNESFRKISDLIVNTMYAIYIVSLQVAILSFLLALPIYYLLGYPAYIQLAIMTGLAMFIPIFGPLVVMLFLVLYNLATGDLTGVLVALLVIYPVVFWIPASIVRPRLMGKRVSIHPVLMMIGIIGGISIMGIIGLILGPLFIALLVSSYQILIDQLTLLKSQAASASP
jgi:predicted PurR-regulated permease PerM